MNLAPDRLIPPRDTWDAMRRDFRWPAPARYNIAEQACERWARAQPDRLAMTYLRPDGQLRDYTYVQLSRASSRLANAFAARGVKRVATGWRCCCRRRPRRF